MDRAEADWARYASSNGAQAAAAAAALKEAFTRALQRSGLSVSCAKVVEMSSVLLLAASALLLLLLLLLPPQGALTAVAVVRPDSAADTCTEAPMIPSRLDTAAAESALPLLLLLAAARAALAAVIC